jgi:hypothetical protein
MMTGAKVFLDTNILLRMILTQMNQHAEAARSPRSRHSSMFGAELMASPRDRDRGQWQVRRETHEPG